MPGKFVYYSRPDSSILNVILLNGKLRVPGKFVYYSRPDSSILNVILLNGK